MNCWGPLRACETGRDTLYFRTFIGQFKADIKGQGKLVGKVAKAETDRVRTRRQF